VDNISSNMKSLCEDIATSHKDRKSDIKQLREQAEAIQNDARKFLAESKILHQKMAKELKQDLQEDRKGLVRNVNSLREDFRKRSEEIRADLAESVQIWNNMNKTLKDRQKQKRGEKR